MKLPRHAQGYLLFIGLLSLFQIALGANLLVLAAIDFVCLCALYPMTRKTFGPNDLLFMSLCFYYGTYSLVLKCFVLQPVQMNLIVPMTTIVYLDTGFGLIFLGYLFVERTMTKHYRGSNLRKWNWLERAYADERFLARFTLPFSIISVIFITVLALFSHSAAEVTNGLAESSGLSSLGSLSPIVQLAFAMQLALVQQRGSQTDRALAIGTFAVAVGLSIFNNQKLLAFWMVFTYALHALAFRIPIRPRFLASALVAGAVAFLYITPLIHIVRGLDVEKSQRLSQTFNILAEAHYNPIELQEIEAKLPGADENTLEHQIDYLAPYNYNTDRFTLMMPIDQMARADLRAPLGIGAFATEMRDEMLPKYIIGEHHLEALADQVAWQYSIRSPNVISRPALGLLGTGFGVAGGWGVLVLAPLSTMIFFAVIKLVCNGSVWQNPWAVFMASQIFFDGEADLTLVPGLCRSLLPLLAIAALVVAADRAFSKGQKRSFA
jgi:hypothetical protein